MIKFSDFVLSAYSFSWSKEIIFPPPYFFKEYEEIKVETPDPASKIKLGALSWIIFLILKDANIYTKLLIIFEAILIVPLLFFKKSGL